MHLYTIADEGTEWKYLLGFHIHQYIIYRVSPILLMSENGCMIVAHSVLRTHLIQGSFKRLNLIVTESYFSLIRFDTFNDQVHRIIVHMILKCQYAIFAVLSKSGKKFCPIWRPHLLALEFLFHS